RGNAVDPPAGGRRHQRRLPDPVAMGLEAVEFVIAVEKAFRLSIPDGTMNDIGTPRELVGYLLRRIPEVDPGFGTPTARWTQTEIEQVVEGLLVKSVGRGDISLDTDFRAIFS